jgi:hypothetical protein
MSTRPTLSCQNSSFPGEGYVEDFDEPRTKLGGFFSVLLAAKSLFSLSQLALDHCTEHGQSLWRDGFET